MTVVYSGGLIFLWLVHTLARPLLLFLVIQPVSEADAFPDGGAELTGGESAQTGPPVGGTGNPPPAR